MPSIFFANLWGLLALLGLPAVLLIHRLRRRSRQVKVSTMFLIERALPSSEGGRRLRTLRNSLPLWIQLLAVCALTWLLAKPRWIDQESTQTVVAVLDTSASMSAFRQDALDALAQELRKMESASAKSQWIVLDSLGTKLAGGADLAEVLHRVEAGWTPQLGAHDTGEALRLARTMAGEKGTVIYFTDHEPDKAEVAGIGWVAVGHKVDNAGFLGGDVKSGKWSALVKNFSPSGREVQWRVAGNPVWQAMVLPADGMIEISGNWPEGQDRLTLELGGDEFTLDDRLPLIRPTEKPLSVRVEESEPFQKLFEQVLRVAGPTFITGKDADTTLSVYVPERPSLPEGSATVFVEDDGPEQKALSEAIVAENHPLMENLNWQGLIVRDSFGVPVLPTDRVLLWQGSRPLIFVRAKGAARQLIFNFDVRHSNALRLPAFAILNYRFFGLLRDEKIAYSAANAETRQRVKVAGADPAEAPGKPDFFAVKARDGTVLFDGAAQFSDPRESDFSAAETGRSANLTAQVVRQAHERGAFLDPLWVSLLVALLLWNWFLTGGAPVGRLQPA